MNHQLRWHGERMKLQATNDSIKEQQATALIAEGSRHFVGAPLDLPKQALNDVVGANAFPVLTWEGIKGQTGIQIALQTGHRRWIDTRVLFDESSYCLVSLRSMVLIKQGFEFWLHLITLLRGNVAEHVFHFMLDTALPQSRGKFGREGIDHGLIAITDKQINLLYPSLLQIVKERFPGSLVLAISHREGQHRPLAIGSNAVGRKAWAFYSLLPGRSP